MSLRISSKVFAEKVDRPGVVVDAAARPGCLAVEDAGHAFDAHCLEEVRHRFFVPVIEHRLDDGL